MVSIKQTLQTYPHAPLAPCYYYRSEVGGVYFNGLFCGRQSKRTYNGVRLGINLAVDHNRALESGVWELWITVEPAVHHFSPVDW